jgi:hypothetical protein
MSRNMQLLESTEGSREDLPQHAHEQRSSRFPEKVFSEKEAQRICETKATRHQTG